MPLPIACGQTISQPSIVGLMTQALALSPRDKVLEVGTGSGYQAAILGQLVRRVYTIDRHRRLVQAARALIEEFGITNVTAIVGDGSFGIPEQAPFDRILVTAAAEDPPSPLLAQLRIGGIMVLPVGQSDAVQSLIRVTRHETGYDYEELCAVRFVPLVEGVGRTDGAAALSSVDQGPAPRPADGRTGQAMQTTSSGPSGLGWLRRGVARSTALPAALSVLLVAGCGERALDLDLRGFADGFSTATAAEAVPGRPRPDDRGVISYPNYQVVVAQRGDTVSSIAGRLGARCRCGGRL